MHRSLDGLRVLRAHTGLNRGLQIVGTRSARGTIKRYGPAFVSMGNSDVMKIKRVDDFEIVFDDGQEITFDHYQDCCEANYAAFDEIDDLAFLIFRDLFGFFVKKHEMRRLGANLRDIHHAALCDCICGRVLKIAVEKAVKFRRRDAFCAKVRDFNSFIKSF